MRQPSEKIAKYLIIFVIAIVLIKSINGSGFFESKNYKGKGFKIRIPEGWTKIIIDKDAVYPQGTDFIELVPKGTNLELGPPLAIISVLSTRLETPIWIEDEFPDIVQSIRDAGHAVKDKGEIKIDEKTASWIVYLAASTPPALVLEFYIVTDNGTFIKLQYSADPDYFKQYRPYFEQFRESFKFRFSL